MRCVHVPSRGCVRRAAGAAIFVASALLFSSRASAEERVIIGLSGGYMTGGSAEGTAGNLRAKASIASAPSYGGLIDVAVRPGAFAEFSYTLVPTEIRLQRTDTDTQQTDTQHYDMSEQLLHVGGLLEFRTPSAEWLRPYFGGTIGATVFSADDAGFTYDEWRMSLAFEGGARVRLTRFLGFRLRARGIGTFLTDNSALFCGSGGNCAFAYSGSVVIQGDFGGSVYIAF